MPDYFGDLFTEKSIQKTTSKNRFNLEIFKMYSSTFT